MLPINLQSPDDIERELGDRLRQLRVQQELRQGDLAERAGVDVKALRRFEQSGQGSVSTLVRICFALGVQNQLAALFPPPPAASLHELLDEAAPRRRVRLKR